MFFYILKSFPSWTLHILIHRLSYMILFYQYVSKWHLRGSPLSNLDKFPFFNTFSLCGVRLVILWIRYVVLSSPVLSRNSVCFLFMIFLSTDEIASNLKPFILTICRSHKYHGLVWKSSSPKTGSVSGKKEFWVSHKIEPKDKSYVKHRKHFWDSHKTESRRKGFVKYRKGFWVSHKIEPRQRWKLCKIQKTFLRFTEYKTKT